MDRVYLGDGLFAEYDGFQLAIAANNGVLDTATVYLDEEVIDSLIKYIKNIRGAQTL